MDKVEGYRTSGAGQKQYGQAGSARARAMARRRRRERQRRMIICGILCLLVGVIVGAGFGISRYKRNTERKGYLTEAILALDRGEYEAAVAKIDQALEDSGKRIGKFEKNALLFRAEAEYRQGEFAEALEDYERLLEADPEQTDYKKGAVLCLLETGDFERALSFGELRGRVYVRMAETQIEAGEYEQAEKSIEAGMAVGEAEDVKDLAYCQAVLWEYKGEFKKALECFTQYQEQYGGDEQIDREIAFLKTRQGND